MMARVAPRRGGLWAGVLLIWVGVAAPAVAQQEKPWDCSGPETPDIPAGTQVEHQTFVVSKQDANSVQFAKDVAARRLAERVCAGWGGCEVLAAKITTWRKGENATHYCATAVVSMEHVTKWRRNAGSLADLDKRLLEVAQELVRRVGKGKRKLRLGIEKVVVNGVGGGRLAAWLSGQLKIALTQAGAVVREIPPGARFPRAFDRIVEGRIFPIFDGGIQKYDIQFHAKNRKGRNFPAQSVRIPAQTAPKPPAKVRALPPSDPGLSIRMDKRGNTGGSLCLGDNTQIYLTSKYDAEVVVLDLYGKGEAIVIFPNEEHRKGTIKAGQSIALREPHGFDILPVGGEVERFVVLAAKNRRALGRYGSWQGECKVPAAIARRLHAGKGIPKGVRMSHDGFRLIRGGVCPPPPGPEIEAQLQAQLKTMKVCR